MYGSLISSFVARFAARFEPSRDGYLYFHGWSSGGIVCSEDEMRSLTERYRRFVRSAVGVVLLWALVVLVGAAIIASIGAGPVSVVSAFTIAFAPGPFVLLLAINASNAPLKAFQGRAVIAPPRRCGRAPWYERPWMHYSISFVWAALFALLVWQAGFRPEFVPLMGLNALMFLVSGMARQSRL